MAGDEKSQGLNRGKNEHVHELQVEIGKMISERRISKGLSLEQVEATTKISRYFLESIERGKFEDLPGKVFGRGFVKSIAKVLDLDYQVLLEKYEKSWIYNPEVINEKGKSHPFFSREQAQKIAFDLPQSIFKNFTVRRFASYVLIPVLLGLIVFFIKFVMMQDRSQVEPQTLSETQKAKEPLVLDTEGKTPPAPMTVASKETPQNTNTVSLEVAESHKVQSEIPKKVEAPVGDKGQVVLTVKEDVKIKHRMLPDEYTTTTFTPGVYRFTVEERMDIVVLDAAVVDLTFNGKSLGVLGKKGEERKFSFFAKELTSAAEKKSDDKS